MPVTTEEARNDYIGNGTVSTYAFTFPVLGVDDFNVYRTDIGGTLVTLARGADYTVALDSVTRIGSITLTAGALASGYKLAIVDDQPLTQLVTLTNSNKYPPATVERALDRIAMQLRTLKEMDARSISFPRAEKSIGLLPDATARASKYLGFDPDGALALASPPTSNSGAGIGTSVRSFGATGTFITDDTDAIQACIEAVRAAGGGVVYFPSGTYLVRIAQTASATFKHALTIYPGIVLRGESRERSVIRLRSGAGNYNAIISRALVSDTDMNDFGMCDLCIDQNNTGNAPTLLTDLTNTGNYRYAVLCFGGRRITVKNCWFKDFKSINTISVNAPITLCGDVQIVGNRFDHGASSSVANDHSTIYTNADTVLIDGNQFNSPAIATYGATTAIEMHGSYQFACNNTIKNYRIGCNMTGVAYESNNLSFVNNSVEGACYGVVLWSWFYGGNTTKAALTNCVISGNVIRINRDPWGAISADISCGVTWDQTGTAPCEGIVITDNIIHFEPTTVTNVSDNYSWGIGWDRPTVAGVGYDQDITIKGNIITGAPANGLRIYGPIRRLTIDGNTIRNCGQSTSGAFVTAFRAGIFAYSPGPMLQWLVNGNRFVDDQATPTMTMGLSTGGSQASNCQFTDNVWTVSAGHAWPVFAGSYVAGEAWYVRHVFDTYPVGQVVTGEIKAGSTLTVTSTGVVNTQVTAPQGYTYVPQTARLFGQFQVTWGQASGLGALDCSADWTAQFNTAAYSLLGGTVPGVQVYKGPNNTQRGMQWWTVASSRWSLLADGNETGSATGSDLKLFSYNDAGVFVDTSFVWTRAAGKPFFWYRPMAIEKGLSPAQLIVTAASITLTAADAWVTFTGTAQCVMTAPAASEFGSARPWVQWVKNRSFTAEIIYQRQGVDTIDGLNDSVTINPGETAMFIGNGASDIAISQRSGGDASRIFTRHLRGVSLNSAATDVRATFRLTSAYRVRRVTVTNASVSLTTATFSLRTGASGSGVAIVAGQGLAALTTSAKVTESTIASTDRQGAFTLYLRCDTAQGVAATADFIIEFEDLR